MFSTTLHPLAFSDGLVRTSPLSLVFTYSNERLGFTGNISGEKGSEFGTEPSGVKVLGI